MSVSLLIPRASAVVTERRGLRRTQVNAVLWRVTQPGGAVVGYIERRPEGTAAAFRVKRMNRDFKSFTALGDFDEFEEAFDGLRRM